MPALSEINIYSADNALNNGSVIQASDHNTHRGNVRSLFQDELSYLADLEKNFSSASEPTDKDNGKVWYDSGNTVWKGRKAAAWVEIVDVSATQTLSNKTFATITVNGASQFNNGVNVATGYGLSINAVSVLTATTLGSSVVNSSLTSVGALNSGSITSGFGSIDVGTSDIDGGVITAASQVIIGSGTPLSWGAEEAIQFGSKSGITGTGANDEINILYNSYFDGANYKYSSTALANRINFGSGGISALYATSGTAGSNISWSTAATITTTGNFIVENNIGVNTSSPQQPLDISGVSGTNIRISSTKNDGSWTPGTTEYGGIEWYSADVSGPGAGIRASIDIVEGSSSGEEPQMVFSVASSTTNEVERMRIDHNGVVIVPFVYSHDMNGETYRDLLINSSGELGYDSSTQRKKTNIANMEDTSWLYDLRPVNFEYKAKEFKVFNERVNGKLRDVTKEVYTEKGNGKKEYGLIAEEVEKLCPQMVFYDDDIVEGVHYKKLIPVLLNEVIALNGRILALEA